MWNPHCGCRRGLSNGLWSSSPSRCTHSTLAVLPPTWVKTSRRSAAVASWRRMRWPCSLGQWKAWAMSVAHTASLHGHVQAWSRVVKLRIPSRILPLSWNAWSGMRNLGAVGSVSRHNLPACALQILRCLFLEPFYSVSFGCCFLGAAALRGNTGLGTCITVQFHHQVRTATG